MNEQVPVRLAGWRDDDVAWASSMNAYVIGDVIMSCVAAQRALSAATTSCACASFLCLFIAVTTDYWLYTVERVSDDSNATAPSVYLATSSGLWRKCTHKRKYSLLTRSETLYCQSSRAPNSTCFNLLWSYCTRCLLYSKLHKKSTRNRKFTAQVVHPLVNDFTQKSKA